MPSPVAVGGDREGSPYTHPVGPGYASRAAEDGRPYQMILRFVVGGVVPNAPPPVYKFK